MQKLLVVGCGSIGRCHIKNFKAASVSDVVGVDQPQDRLDQAIAEVGIDKGYQDYQTTLDSENFDTVAITAPSYVYIPIVIAAAKKGCHFFKQNNE